MLNNVHLKRRAVEGHSRDCGLELARWHLCSWPSRNDTWPQQSDPISYETSQAAHETVMAPIQTYFQVVDQFPLEIYYCCKDLVDSGALRSCLFVTCSYYQPRQNLWQGRTFLGVSYEVSYSR